MSRRPNRGGRRPDRKPSEDRPSDKSRFIETGEGIRVIRPGRGEIDLSSLPPPREPEDA